MNKTSILIVEDDRPIRNLIVTTLKTHEYKYLTAENGREAILEAKDEIHSLRSEAEKENRERRAEVQRQERRIIQKEESLDKKTEALEAKEEALNEKVKTADKKLEEVEKIKKSQFDMLEKISGYTKEQAKTLLLQNLDEELTHDKAVKIMDLSREPRMSRTLLRVR